MGKLSILERLIEPLLTGQIGWADAVGLAVYGIEFKSAEPVPTPIEPTPGK